MAVTLYQNAVVIPHAPDWRQPLDWSRSWDTRVESAVSGSESRVGLRLKPREKIHFRLVPFDLAERLALVERLKAAANLGLALTAHWGRGSQLMDFDKLGALGRTRVHWGALFGLNQTFAK